MTAHDGNQMTAIEIARCLAELGQAEKALEAYALVLKQGDAAAEDRLEAALAVLQYGNDYKSAYDALIALYREGAYRADILGILTEAFYLPNEREQKKQYEKNCRLLNKYPYLFRKDFLPFEELPVKFYPYDDNGVLPFYIAEECFDEYTDVREPEIKHWFFRDLEKPILAHDIFSQYELEYLKDNVRRSDWVARENHIYLHYADWGTFCSWLSLLNLKPLLEEEKFVFLIGEEISQYPIDFKERFGIDYSQYPVKPFSVREFHKLIWHTQLGYHNGGDFFNEIMHDHPYILFDESRYLGEQTEMLVKLQKTTQKAADSNRGREIEIKSDVYNPDVLRELLSLKRVTLKDSFVGFYLSLPEHAGCLDKNSRIVPALFYQPHFSYQSMNWVPNAAGGATLEISGWEEVKNSPIFNAFKYIKTFTPMRRPTTSLGGTMRFVEAQIQKVEADGVQEGETTAKLNAMSDLLLDFMMNRSFMVDKKNRMFRDSRLVRFEDGKLNPKATFTALAEFLDVPYTESMTYCSDRSGKNPQAGYNVAGFDPATVYRTYDRFMDSNERYLLEYTLREAYTRYGYDFQYYDGKSVTKEELSELLENSQTIFSFADRAWRAARKKLGHEDSEELDNWVDNLAQERKTSYQEQRQLVVSLLGKNLRFYNKDGDSLHYMKKLEPIPELLEQPLYH